jgi:hypothetical protein
MISKFKSLSLFGWIVYLLMCYAFAKAFTFEAMIFNYGCGVLFGTVWIMLLLYLYDMRMKLDKDQKTK